MHRVGGHGCYIDPEEVILGDRQQMRRAVARLALGDDGKSCVGLTRRDRTTDSVHAGLTA